MFLTDSLRFAFQSYLLEAQSEITENLQKENSNVTSHFVIKFG